AATTAASTIAALPLPLPLPLPARLTLALTSLLIAARLLLARLAAALRGEGDALARVVDLEDADGQLLTDLDDLGRILDELLRELADVDEAVVVDADVDERTECGDVRDDAFEHHAGLEVLHRGDVVAEPRRRELGTRIAARLRELGGDVL